MHAVAVEMQLLLIDRNENLLRPFRNFDGRFFAGAIGGFRLVRFVCASMLVPAAVPTAIPVSGRRGRRTRCQGQTCGEGERGHAAADAAVPPTLPLVASRTRDVQLCPRQRGIVLSPAQILVDGISFRQVASVTPPWRIAAKLRSSKHNGTQPSADAIYGALVCLPCAIAHRLSALRLNQRGKANVSAKSS